jgi:hypothetical protein
MTIVRRGAVPPAVGAGMATRRIVVHASDVVFAKGIVEALDGVAAVFAEGGGDLVLASPLDREQELDELAHDLAAELGGIIQHEDDRAPTAPQHPHKPG